MTGPAGSVNASNSTTIPPLGVAVVAVTNFTSAVGQNADTTLWAVGRITQIGVVLLIVGACIAFRKPIRALCAPFFAKCSEGCRLRAMKRCCLKGLSKLCCCCPCNGAYESLAEAHEVLTVTLIGADELKKPMNFYVEVWTEPQEAASKISRTQLEAKPNTSISLGMEKLELDWYGDEENVIIQLVEFPSAGKAKPIGDIVLKGKKVFEYCAEAKKNPGDMQAGTRRFDLLKLNADQMTLRKKKLTSAEPQNIMMSFMLSKVQDKIGLGTGMALSDEATAQLQKDNADLQKENDELRGALVRTSSAGSLNSTSSQKAKPKIESVAKLVLRFEISSRRAPDRVDLMKYQAHDTEGP